MLRLVGNSNPGYFNNEWVPYSTVQELLAKQDQGKAITSFVLTPLFRGKIDQLAFLPVRRPEAGRAGASCPSRRSVAMTGAVMPPSCERVKKLIDGKDVPATSSKGKAGKNNKGKVAEATPATITEAATPEPAAQEPAEKPLIVLTDVPR